MRNLNLPWLQTLVLGCLLATGIPGCATLQEIFQGTPKPGIRLERVRFAELTLDHLTLEFDAEVENPYGVELPLLGLDVALAHEGENFLKADAPLSGSIPAQETRTVTVPARVDFESALALVQQLKPGTSIPYRADVGVKVNAPALGELRLPFSHRGELGIPLPPSVKVSGVNLARLSLTEIRAECTLEASSPNRFPVQLSSLDYTFKVRDQALATTRITSPFDLEPGGTVRWSLPLSINPLKAGQIFLSLFREESISYGLQGDLTLGTPFGSLQAPLSVNDRAPIR
ncbi:MAG: LEA type 2 family protein [Myxococcota bacterium]